MDTGKAVSCPVVIWGQRRLKISWISAYTKVNAGQSNVFDATCVQHLDNSMLGKVLKYVILFHFQLRRMQEMIAQMQAQMKSQS